MPDDLIAYLYDIQHSALAVKQFVAGQTLESYSSNDLLRSAVERKFEIMGEALIRIKREDPTCLESIRNHRDIISFRNILIHGYNSIDNRIVWAVIQESLNNLITDASKLLQEITE